jgi:hypothetical protein
LKDDPLGLQVKQSQPQGKRSGRCHAVVNEEQASAHDSTRIDDDIIEAYTLGASERLWRRNSVSLSLAELADPDEPFALTQQIIKSFTSWRHWEVTINVNADGTRAKARHRLYRLR